MHNMDSPGWEYLERFIHTKGHDSALQKSCSSNLIKSYSEKEENKAEFKIQYATGGFDFSYKNWKKQLATKDSWYQLL